MAAFLQGKTEVARETGVVLRTLEEMWRDILDLSPALLIALIVLLFFVVIGQIVKWILRAAVRATPLSARLGLLLGRLAGAVFAVLGLLVGAVIVFPAFRPGDLVAGLGITSVAIGFAFKDILQNFMAGIFLLWRQPFQIGDQIKVKEFEGTVEDIQFRSTWLTTYDGERAIIPNGDVYTSSILVRTAFPARRARFLVGIGYPESVEKARRTIHNALERTEEVLSDPGPWVYLSELGPSSVNFTVYFWCRSRQANVLRAIDRVAESIKLALDEASIEIPYPHTVVLVQDSAPHPPEQLLRPPRRGNDRSE